MTSWFRLNLGSREVQARTAGVFAATFVVGLIINGLALLLSAMSFAPLQAIVAADEQLYFAMTTPRISDPNQLHRVVLVDIDDEAVPPDNAQNGGSAPRALIADVIHQIRAQNPVAIFLDVDLRNGLSDDKALKDELGRQHRPPVLIPYFLEGVRSGCTDQDRVPATQRPVLLGIPFRAVSAPDSVIEVHGLMETGAYGLVGGTCSAFLLRQQSDTLAQIPAAMIVAARLAGHKVSPNPLRVIQPRWRIRDKQEPAGAPANPRWGNHGQSLYTWMPAGDLRFARPDLFKSAIVIVGSSQSGSDDVHYTPVGPMMGALIHVNLALDLQQPETRPFGWWTAAWQVVLDTLLTLVTSIAVALLWHPLHLRLGRHGQPTFLQRCFRLGGELGIVLLALLLASGGTLLIADLGGGAGGLALWRFSFISSLLAAVFVVVMEATFLLGETARSGVEQAVRHPQKRSGTTRRKR